MKVCEWGKYNIIPKQWPTNNATEKSNYLKACYLCFRLVEARS